MKPKRQKHSKEDVDIITNLTFTAYEKSPDKNPVKIRKALCDLLQQNHIYYLRPDQLEKWVLNKDLKPHKTGPKVNIDFEKCVGQFNDMQTFLKF